MDSIVTTPSQTTTVKLAWLVPLADREVSVSSGARSEGGELPTTDASTWWLLVIASLLALVGIGLRLVEAWRRVR